MKLLLAAGGFAAATTATMILIGCSANRNRADELAPATSPDGVSRAWRFDDVAEGALPPDFELTETNPRGNRGAWSVATDGSNRVLKLQTHNSGSTFNMCVVRDVTARDVDVSVRLRADTGEEDQGGGLVWRYQDANNYYTARGNPLETNFRLYKVIDSKRTQLASVSANTKTGQWVMLRIVHVGDQIDCYLDGQRVIAAKDDTITQPGRIGLWTKADASTSFDDLALSGAR